MNKKRLIILAGFCFLLTSCSRQNGEVNFSGNTEELDDSVVLEANSDSDTIETTEENPDVGMIQEGIVSSEDGVDAEEDTFYVIDNPGSEYYLTEKIVCADDFEISLEQLTQESNGITDEEKWFTDNKLSWVESNYMEDEQYCYRIYGDNAFCGYLLDISYKATGENLGCLSFEKYRYIEPVKEGDEAFVEQEIRWAQAVEDVLYVSIGHDTYTESCPNTGYLVAIDLNDMSVIWKSEPCVTNGRNFEVIANTIVCGYGFTSEPDYLILVDRLDGSVKEKLLIKSKAEYILYQDDTLYVRTYNTNYMFRVDRTIARA